MAARCVRLLWCLVFLWMGDHLAAFFALPPTQLLVRGAQDRGTAQVSRGGVGRGRGRRGLHTGAGGRWAPPAAVPPGGPTVGDAGDGNTVPVAQPNPSLLGVGDQCLPRGRGGGRVRGLQSGRGRGAARGRGRQSQFRPMPQPQQSAGAGSAGTPSVPSVKAEKEMLWEGKNSGKLPNMMWRAVSMDDLRLHPHFIPLPEPQEIVIESALDFRSFRQGSLQWCLLHDGERSAQSVV